MKRITINIGFITNSSSVVHWFPRELLEDPGVKSFLQSYEIEGGYLGDNLWYRNACGSFVATRAQREEMNAKMNYDDEYGGMYGPMSDPDSDDLIVIHGDEHPGISSILCTVLKEACSRLGLNPGTHSSYN